MNPIEAISAGVFLELYWPLLLAGALIYYTLRIVEDMMERSGAEKSAIERKKFQFGVRFAFASLTGATILLLYYMGVFETIIEWTSKLAGILK